MNVTVKTLILGAILIANPVYATTNLAEFPQTIVSTGYKAVEHGISTLSSQVVKMSGDFAANMVANGSVSMPSLGSLVDPNEMISMVADPIKGELYSVAQDQANHVLGQVQNEVSSAATIVQNEAGGVWDDIKSGAGELYSDVKSGVGDLVGSSGGSSSGGSNLQSSFANAQASVKESVLTDTSSPEALASSAENQRNQLLVTGAKTIAVAVEGQVNSVLGQAEAKSAFDSAADGDNFAQMNKEMAAIYIQMSQKLNTIGGLYSQMTELNAAGALLGQEKVGS